MKQEKDYKAKFRAFLEGLDMDNITLLMEEDCDYLRKLGAFYTKEFRRMKFGSSPPDANPFKR